MSGDATRSLLPAPAAPPGATPGSVGVLETLDVTRLWKPEPCDFSGSGSAANFLKPILNRRCCLTQLMRKRGRLGFVCLRLRKSRKKNKPENFTSIQPRSGSGWSSVVSGN